MFAAVFVGSFERGMYVYFFFHETGTEFKGCMQKTVSRVARVCKVRKFKVFTIWGCLRLQVTGISRLCKISIKYNFVSLRLE